MNWRSFKSRSEGVGKRGDCRYEAAEQDSPGVKTDKTLKDGEIISTNVLLGQKLYVRWTKTTQNYYLTYLKCKSSPAGERRVG